MLSLIINSFDFRFNIDKFGGLWLWSRIPNWNEKWSGGKQGPIFNFISDFLLSSLPYNLMYEFHLFFFIFRVLFWWSFSSCITNIWAVCYTCDLKNPSFIFGFFRFISNPHYLNSFLSFFENFFWKNCSSETQYFSEAENSDDYSVGNIKITRFITDL